MQSGNTCTRDGWRKISLHSFPDPKKNLQNTEIRYKTLFTPSITVFIVCQATCFDLNYRSSSGLLKIEFTNTVHVGIPSCLQALTVKIYVSTAFLDFDSKAFMLVDVLSLTGRQFDG